MVELPIRNSTGLLPFLLEPGTGRAVIALAILSGVLSTTPFTSFGASATCACAPSAQAIMHSANSRFILQHIIKRSSTYTLQILF